MGKTTQWMSHLGADAAEADGGLDDGHVAGGQVRVKKLLRVQLPRLRVRPRRTVRTVRERVISAQYRVPTRVERRWALPEAAAVGQCGPQPAHGETVVVLGPVAGPVEIRHEQGVVGEELQQADGQGVEEGHVGTEKNDRVVRPRCMGKGRVATCLRVCGLHGQRQVVQGVQRPHLVAQRLTGCRGQATGATMAGEDNGAIRRDVT